MAVRHLWTAKNLAENGYCTSEMLRHLSTYIAANHVHIELWMLTDNEQVQMLWMLTNNEQVQLLWMLSNNEQVQPCGC